jgi:hypothetical protein
MGILQAPRAAERPHICFQAQIRSNQFDLADTGSRRILRSKIDKAGNLLSPITVTITFPPEVVT